MTELRAADLRFSEAETGQFLREEMGLALSAEDISRLAERTEGWVAGINLVGISLQGRDNPGAFVQNLSGAHRYILNYLTEEVLKKQPPDAHNFLLETAILSRLSGELCDAVTGQTNSASLLERLLAANLFIIPLDDEGRWYRYHHLFTDLLQHKLRREHSDRLPELHRRASLWYEQQGMPIPAIEYALAAGDYPRVIAALEQYQWRLLTQGHLRELMQWVEALPEDLRYSRPKINAAIVWGKILQGDYMQAGPYLAAAQEALEKQPPDNVAGRALQADLLALQAIMAQAKGKPPEALALAEKAKSLAPTDDLRLIGSTSLAFSMACRMSGKLDEAVAALQQSLRAAHAIADHITAMVAVAHLSLIWYPLGRLRLLAETGELAIERAEKVYVRGPLPEIYPLPALKAQTWIAQGNLNEALLWARKHELSVDDEIGFIGEYEYLTFARLMLAMHQCERDPGALEDAIILLQRLQTEAEAGHRGGSLIKILVVQALALRARGDTSGALAALEYALKLAEPEGYVRVFVDEGAPMRRLISDLRLTIANQKSPLVEYMDKLLANFQQPAKTTSQSKAPNQESALLEPLSERELEVLRWLCSELSGPEIARQLSISLNTFRTHTKNIFNKLNVNSRRAAVRRAEEIDLF